MFDSSNICTVVPSQSFFVLLTTALLIGVSHCAGMCGPLVSAFVVRQRVQRQEVSTPLLIFQLGRLTTYLILGLIAGAIGSVVRIALIDPNWQSTLSIFMGLLLIISGLKLQGLFSGQKVSWWSRVPHRLSRKIRHLLQSQKPTSMFLLGISNGLLPCGALYTMILLAAASSDPLAGVTIMLIFGLGTLPSLLGIGLFAAQLGMRWRSQLYRFASVLILLVGLQLILRGLAQSNQITHLSIGGLMLW